MYVRLRTFVCTHESPFLHLLLHGYHSIFKSQDITWYEISPKRILKKSAPINRWYLHKINKNIPTLLSSLPINLYALSGHSPNAQNGPAKQRVWQIPGITTGMSVCPFKEIQAHAPPQGTMREAFSWKFLFAHPALAFGGRVMNLSFPNFLSKTAVFSY